MAGIAPPPRPFSAAFDAHYRRFGYWSRSSLKDVETPFLRALDKAFPDAMDVSAESDFTMAFECVRLGANVAVTIRFNPTELRDYNLEGSYLVAIERLAPPRGCWSRRLGCWALCFGPTPVFTTVHSLNDITPAFVAAHLKDE